MIPTEVLSERDKVERKRKGKKDGGEGEENVQHNILELHNIVVREARSLPAFEILRLVWRNEGRLSPQNTFLPENA